MEGRLLKAISGFFYTECGNTVYECKASGVFRKEKKTPLAGDIVTFDVLPNQKGYITGILPRKNELIRPPVANADQLILLSASVCPTPNTRVLDQITAIAAHMGISCVLVFNKSDLKDVEEYCGIYRRAGYPVFSISCETGEGVEEIRPLLSGKLSVFTGNTGVGKSSLLNRLFPEMDLKTGEVSEKLGRGRHTTRQVELFRLDENTLVADTPGFSLLDFDRLELIRKDELAGCFPEFGEYTGCCRFTSCSHTKEKGCAVLEALREGSIEPSRHESYVSMYEEAKKIKEWELK